MLDKGPFILNSAKLVRWFCQKRREKAVYIDRQTDVLHSTVKDWRNWPEMKLNEPGRQRLGR